MAVQVELFLADSFPPHLSPHLDVLVPESQVGSVFRKDSDPPTVLFTPQRPHGSGQPGVFMRVHPTCEEGPAGCGGGSSGSVGRVRLLTSRLFLRLHGRSGNTGTVRVLEPVRLDRVVLGARGGQQFPGGLLELCRPGQELLARRGEPLLPPGQHLDLLVLDCSPVTQGWITADTALVLTDCCDWPEPAGPPPSSRPTGLYVSDFAHYAAGLGVARSLLDNRKLLLGSGLSGVLRALECQVDVRVVDARQWFGVKGRRDAVDVDGCVFVSRQLLLRLGLFNGEWVRLSRGGGASRQVTVEGGGASRQVTSEGGGASRERLVSVVAVDWTLVPELQDDVGFISETLWFNLTDGGDVTMDTCSLRMKRWQHLHHHHHHHHLHHGGRRSDSFCRSASPSSCGELHLRPVASPLYDSLRCYDDLLAEHFSTPRLVAVGDVLMVPVDDHLDLLESGWEADPRNLNRCPALFFKVQKVCPSTGTEEEEEEGGGAYLADRQHTSLYLGASTSSRVPFGSGGGACLSPPGLGAAVELLRSIILPHLQHSSSLSACTVLLHGPAGSGKVTVVAAATSRLHLHLLKVDCVSVCADTPAASEAKLTSVFQRAASLQPCVLLLRNLQLLLPPRGAAGEDGRVQAAVCRLLTGAPSSVTVVATVCRPRELSAGVMAAFVHQVALESPGEEQRRAMLVGLSQELHLGRDVDLDRLAKLTMGLVLGDLRALLVQAGRAACKRLVLSCVGRQEEDLCASGVTILNQDFSSALETLQDAQSRTIGAPKVPEVRWEDVGGLQQVKRDVLDTVQLPLQRPELLSLGLNRTGVLLYGPPGTGKTLLAKAVATETSSAFLSVKGPELINMFVGQSEANIREVFSRARAAAPCLVFFDELDSLAPSRGRSGDSGGVMDRVVSQLLSELDAINSSVGVFVIGATNRPDLLDQSLLRPGRFDKLVYVGVNEDRVSQLQVLQAVLRKFQVDPGVNLQQLLERCPAHMTGADLYALCSDAMTTAVKRKIRLIDSGQDSEDSPVLLAEEDFSTALDHFRPSVSDQELLRYQHIRHKLTAQ